MNRMMRMTSVLAPATPKPLFQYMTPQARKAFASRLAEVQKQHDRAAAMVNNGTVVAK
jgi:hypothetical protein